MVESKRNDRGVILFIVLGTILVVVFLANAILALISNQTRFTHHQVSRIQGYYASWAGINYAYEMLSNGGLAIPTVNNPRIITMCAPGGGCTINENFDNNAAGTRTAVQSVRITIANINDAICGNPPPPAGAQACIRSTADYALVMP
ncbi:MAG: hypothetical protein PHO70_08135 [Candidatus Omnitrophica bacterium]|nr:hypothetical protein [Candidatus Omnitrophota bacterium]